MPGENGEMRPCYFSGRRGWHFGQFIIQGFSSFFFAETQLSLSFFAGGVCVSRAESFEIEIFSDLLADARVYFWIEIWAARAAFAGFTTARLFWLGLMIFARVDESR